MNIEQFEVFRTIAEAKSFTKAAKILNFTQPAISSQIKLLEQSFDVSLFERGNNGVKLTEAGRKFYEYGEKVLALYEEMESEIAKMSGQNIEYVKIGASYTAGDYVLPCSIINFKEQHPAARIRLDIGHTKEVLRSLKERAIDIGIVDEFIDGEKEFVTEKIASYPVVLVAPANHRWRQTSFVSLNELMREPFIAREEESEIRKHIKDALKSQAINFDDFNILTEISTFEAIKRAVIAEKGVSLIPYPVVKKELADGTLIEIKTQSFDLSINIQIVCRANDSLSGLKNAFLKFIMNEALQEKERLKELAVL